MPIITVDLIDDDTLLARVDFQKLRRWVWKLYPQRNRYQLRVDNLHGMSVAFQNAVHDDIGDAPQLRANSLTGADGSETDNAWDNEYGLDFFPLTTNGTFWNPIEWIFDTFWASVPIERDEDTWKTMIGTVSFFAGNRDARFALGMAQRLTTRYLQMKVAGELVNIYGLDNRGRPASE